jgi:hypothetical protein
VTSTIALWFYQKNKLLQDPFVNIPFQYNNAKDRSSGAMGISQDKLKDSLSLTLHSILTCSFNNEILFAIEQPLPIQNNNQ